MLNGFTLVELLTVLAIISILAALLLSSMRSIREQGRSIACVNNLRQLGTALFSYRNDNNDMVPGRGDGAHPPYWFVALAPYVDNKTNTVFRCPSTKKFKCNMESISYGYNIFIQGNSADAGFFVRYSNIVNPAAKYFLMDSDGPVYNHLVAPPPIWDQWYGIGKRHTGGSNVLYLDGHVSWQEWSKIVASDEWKNVVE